MNEIGDDRLEDPRVLEAVREYQAAFEAGKRPSRREFLGRYPDVADALADCLDGLEFLHSAAARLSPADGVFPANVPDPGVEIHPEAPLGDFRIVRELGRGGMGVVYEAVQLSLGRRVALKVLPFAATLDPKQLQRFRNEAQAAAALQHPNIVPVYSVGCERGVHFYAMQLIDGRTVAALIAELRRLSHVEKAGAAPATAAPSADTAAILSTQHSTRGRMFFRTAAEVGVQAAEALEHAHQTGVVHRDVKPANLLLDGQGKLWITDFGLARVPSDAGLTATGDLIGTLRYMSPEQASGNPVVDHRADVYSLGATLYEWLTLTPAFDGRTRQEFLQQIVGRDPVSPRKLNRAVPVDLETIVLKAMAKAPDERYATAGEMAADLRRFMEDKPIQARRPNVLEKAAKWSRRHRPLVAAAVGLLLAVVVGLTISTVLIAREQARTKEAYDLLAQEQTKTQAAYEAEATDRARAEDASRQARQVLNFFTQVTEEELPDQPELRDVRRKLLEAALRYYKDFIDQHSDDPAIHDELLASQWRAAALLDAIGSKADALAAFEQARRALEGVYRDTPPPPFFHGPPPFPGGGHTSGLPALLTQKPVREELKLSETQTKAIAQFADDGRREPPPGPGHGDGDWDRRLAKRAADEKALADLLSRDQAKRLREIVWQQRGAHALGDADAAEALRLTPDQTKRIRSIQDEARQTLWAPPGRHGHRPDGSKTSEEYWKAVSGQILDVLTPEQKAQWTALLGEPFHGEVRLVFPPPPGPPPPFRRPGGP